MNGVIEDCFDDINGNEKAAWVLGFFIADGCLRESKSGQQTLKVGVAEVDADAVEHFKSLVKPTANICIDKCAKSKWNASHQSVVIVTSKHLFKVLNDYGITVRKTGTEHVDSRFINNRHVWRGLVDGDGQISRQVGRKGTVTPLIGLAGSSEVLITQFRDYCSSITGRKNKITASRLKSGKFYFNYQFIGSPALAVIKNLYEDCTVYLKRKYDKAQEAMKYVPKLGWKVRWGYE